MAYSKKYLHEFARYIDSKSILVINQKGQLKRIFCPFPVVVLYRVYKFEKDQVLIVQAVKVTIDLEDIFIIDRKAYLIQYFGIITRE